MKLKDARDAYYSSSRKLSDNLRNFNLVGIAIFWIFFKGKDFEAIPYSEELLFALALFILSLVFDMLQYIYRIFAWGIFARCKEKSGKKDDDDVVAPTPINYPITIFFVLKVASTFTGFYYIGSFLYPHLSN